MINLEYLEKIASIGSTTNYDPASMVRDSVRKQNKKDIKPPDKDDASQKQVYLAHSDANSLATDYTQFKNNSNNGRAFSDSLREAKSYNKQREQGHF